jgi:hypothetical protein
MDAEELAKQAAEQVRQAIETATKRAEEIVSQAQADAERLRTEAEAKAMEIRSEAEATARAVGSKAEADARERLDEVRRALETLEGSLSGAKAEVIPEPAVEPEPTPPAEPEPGPVTVPEPTPEPVPEPTPPPDETDRPSAVAAPPASANANGTDSAARLVAMKLALDGTSREEARKQLAADYAVDDLDGLLDEVYSKAGK